MTDDIAGQYSDYQDRQEKSSRTIEECVEDTIIAWLDVLYDKEFGLLYTRPQLRDDAQNLIEALRKDGFEITIKKVENDHTAIACFFKGHVDNIGECFGKAVVNILNLPWKYPLVGIPIRFERR